MAMRVIPIHRVHVENSLLKMSSSKRKTKPVRTPKKFQATDADFPAFHATSIRNFTIDPVPFIQSFPLSIAAGFVAI